MARLLSVKCFSWCAGVVACTIGLSVGNAAEKAKPGSAKRCEVDTSLLEASERAEWQGACVDGKPNGKGVLTWFDKKGKTRFFDGETIQGLPQGEGVLHFVNKTRYVGQFLDGKPHGKGTYHLPGGDHYEGIFAGGALQGSATYHYANGDRYVGPLAAHAANGYGTYYLRNGERYEGTFQQGSIAATSTAIYHHANGNRFEGKLAAGRPSGKGILYLRNGERVEGSFTDGEVNGAGRYFFASGARYEGPLVRNRPKGRGMLYLADGGRIEGEFDENALPVGNVALHYANNDRYEGPLVNFLPEGTAVLKMSSGAIYTGEFRQGARTGQGTLKYTQGASYQGGFKDGIREGVGSYLWPDGTRYQGVFRDGVPHGAGEMTWPDGRKYVGDFGDGMPSGRGVFERADGFRLDTTFDRGVASGPGELLMPNKSRFIGNFSGDRRQGKGAVITAAGEKEELVFEQDAPKEDKGPYFSLFKSKEEEIGGLIADGYYGWALRYYSTHRQHFEEKRDQYTGLVERLAAGLAAPYEWRIGLAANMAAMLLVDGERAADAERAKSFLGEGRKQLAQLNTTPFVAQSGRASAQEQLLTKLELSLGEALGTALGRAFAGGQMEDALKIVAVARGMGVNPVNELSLTAFNDFLIRSPEEINSKSDALNQLIKAGFEPNPAKLKPAYDSRLDQVLAENDLQAALNVIDGADSVWIKLMTPERSSRLAGLLASKVRASGNLDMMFDALSLGKEQGMELNNPDLARAWVDVLAAKAETGNIADAVAGLRRARENGLTMSPAVAAGPMTRTLMMRLAKFDVRGMLTLLGELSASGLNLMPEFKKRVAFLRSGIVGGNTPFPFSVKNDSGLTVVNVDDFLDNDQEALEILGRHEYIVLLDVHPRYAGRRINDRKQVQSGFTEGIEEVANPEYQRLETELNNAQLELAQANQARAGGSSPSMPQSFGNQKLDRAMLLLGAISSLTSSGTPAQPEGNAATALSKVQGIQSQLGRTPRMIKQPMKVNYQYEELNVEVLRNVPITAYIINTSQGAYVRRPLSLQHKEVLASTLGIHSKDKTAKKLERLDRIRQIERNALSASLLDILSADLIDGGNTKEGEPPQEGAAVRPLESLPNELTENRDLREQAVMQALDNGNQTFDKAIQELLPGLHEDARIRDEQVLELLRQAPDLPQRSSRDARKLGNMLAKLRLGKKPVVAMP